MLSIFIFCSSLCHVRALNNHPKSQPDCHDSDNKVVVFCWYEIPTLRPLTCSVPNEATFDSQVDTCAGEGVPRGRSSLVRSNKIKGQSGGQSANVVNNVYLGAGFERLFSVGFPQSSVFSELSAIALILSFSVNFPRPLNWIIEETSCCL